MEKVIKTKFFRERCAFMLGFGSRSAPQAKILDLTSKKNREGGFVRRGFSEPAGGSEDN